MAILNNSNAISSGGYDINNSLRFRASASAYLNRTPASAGNTTTWTFSTWVKRGTLSSDAVLIGAGVGATGRTLIYINSTDNIVVSAIDSSVTRTNLVTSAVYRDPSAWYHIVVVYDESNGTSSNRVKLYVNGSQVTAFSSATYPPGSAGTYINFTSAHAISRNPYTSASYFDGYMTDINLIDGQALTPSSFGETDTITGSWVAKKYTGTYGTNGFYLKFSDIATTSGSNAGLGKDFSGNANYWTTNNISVTSGTTYDAMIDSPTLTSATVANYATLNPILQNSWWAAVNRGTIQDGNLTFATGAGVSAFSNFDLVGNSGKWYYEMTCSATDTSNAIVIAAESRSTFEVGYYQNGNKQINSATPAAYGASWTSGDVIGVAIDVPNNNITFYKNNTSQGVINNAFPTGQPVYVGAYYNTSSGSYAFNFGQRPFSYTPPTGYVRMNTFNLPDSTIKKGNTVMDATTYTGTGASNSITNASGFKPDLVWIKTRSTSNDHRLTDSIRGVTKELYSNQTYSEGTDANGLTAFNTNGFTVGSSAAYNGSGVTVVGWQWQAGQGSTSSNTSGSITSTVSVNATAGFSVVTYTGNATSGATIGHGLGVAPIFIIAKNRSSGVTDWPTYHISTGNNGGCTLNETAAKATTSIWWNNTTPTSTLVTLGSGSQTNGSGNSQILYCWAEIAGFSKFGSYTGNGSTDGPFVYTGFRPKFVILKNSSAAGGWVILDTSRNTYNVAGNELYPNSSAAEGTGYTDADFLSNGFKLRVAADPNASSGTYIYMAFAENPFKNSNAR
jgi:hypothetical protein